MPRQPDEHPPPAGQRLLYWLAQAATTVRKDAHASPELIAAVMSVGGETIKRFEKAEHWPRDPDLLIAAYAEVAGLEDAREIYQRALDLWHEHGEAPLVGRHTDGAGLSPGQRFEQQIAARRARPRDQPAPARKTSATPKRTAGP